MILSTLKPILGTTMDDDKHKLALFKLYDFTKGRTDIIDQRMGTYSCKPKSRKWTMVAMLYIIDTARVNGSTIFAMKKEKKCPLKQDSFEIGMDIAMALITPLVKTRSLTSLSFCIKQKVALLIGPPEAPKSNEDLGPSSSKKTGRCHLCIANAVEKKLGRDGHNKISPTYRLCQICGKNLCKQHTVLSCSSCRTSGHLRAMYIILCS